MADAIVLAEGCLGDELGKTANGLVLHSMRDRIVAVVDSTHAGQDAGTVVAGRPVGIPVVGTVADALAIGRPEAFYLGAATIGGVLPPEFGDAIRQALAAGLTVYSGLHTFLGDDPAFAALAARHGARIVDMRRPPAGMGVATGRVHDLATPRVLVMGTDCDVGKRLTVVELVQEARRRGIDAGFVATGQTGCMLGADAGTVIDRVPADFCAGVVEAMVCDVAAQGRDVVFVYGQSSIFHPAYAGVGLSILHGSAPHAVVLQHDPVRTRRVLFDHPAYTIAPLATEIDTLERLGTGKVVAVALNGKRVDDIDAAAAAVSEATGLPAADPLKHGPGPLLDAVLDHLREQGVYDGPRTPLATA